MFTRDWSPHCVLAGVSRDHSKLSPLSHSVDNDRNDVERTHLIPTSLLPGNPTPCSSTELKMSYPTAYWTKVIDSDPARIVYMLDTMFDTATRPLRLDGRKVGICHSIHSIPSYLLMVHIQNFKSLCPALIEAAISPSHTRWQRLVEAGITGAICKGMIMSPEAPKLNDNVRAYLSTETFAC